MKSVLIIFILSSGWMFPHSLQQHNNNSDPTFEGEYKSKQGSLVISKYNVSTGYFEFIISIGDKDCTGEVSGNATLKDGVAKFNSHEPGEHCHLIFTYDGKKTIEVKEEEECEFHGATCYFTDIYKKK